MKKYWWGVLTGFCFVAALLAGLVLRGLRDFGEDIFTVTHFDL